jgi:sterol desaturase/sphingolipid hydroxylase (fatty acid hydroxylase superfamily)
VSVHAPLITATVVIATFAAMLLFEAVAPLRREVEPKVRRVARNLVVAGIAGAVAELLRLPLLVPLIEWTDAEQFGLLNAIPLPGATRVVLGIVLLDYTLWWWHWLSHRLPLLWRFHLVHHIDRDLDASTALRFHFGEHALSLLFRMAQVVLLGTPPAALFIWQAVLFASILFHHSNVRLPLRLEVFVVRFLVTPRMHGIHHSDRRDEANSNWSSILSLWDRLHGTLLLGLRQDEVVIGVPAYQEPGDLKAGNLLLIPFRRQRDDWQGRVDARVPRGSELVG